MGRAGGGGGSRSGGSRSSSRSGGSFRSSGGSRAGGGSYHSRRSSSSSGRGYYSGGHSSYNSYNHYGNNYHSYSNSGRVYGRSTTGGMSFGDIIAIIFVIIIAMFIIFSITVPASGTQSTIERTRVESGLAYDTNVVIKDETGWIENQGQVGRELRKFWDLTGVQPYIIMLDYDETLTTDADKEDNSFELYDEYINREDAILFVYYGERDLENDVGLMCYVLGKQAASVFDGEAIDIWYNNIDYYWYGDGTMTDVYIKAYNKTADTIMSAPTNNYDVIIVCSIAGAIIVIFYITYKIITAKMKREKEKAKETEDILKAAANTTAQSMTDNDDLLNKYK